MTEAQLVLLVGSIGNGLLAGWTAWTVWKDRRDARVHKELMEIKADERDAKEREHRHKMAEVQQMQMFELEKMNRAVVEAKAEAVQTKRDISEKIDRSKAERAAQIANLEAKVDAGIEQANNYNGKIAAIGQVALASRSVELQQEGNEKLEEIAQNTAPPKS